MTGKPCIFLCLVSLVLKANAYPVSQPGYGNTQYVSAAQGIAYTKQPQGFIPSQYVQQQASSSRPVYEGRGEGGGDGLQFYSSQQRQPQQPIQQVLLATNVDRQIQRAAQPAGPLFLHQILQSQQRGQAEEAFATAQRKSTSQTLAGRVQPVPYAAQPSAPQQYQPPPPVRYISRPQPPKYRPQQGDEQEKEDPEDYDPNPSYQFGFDVKDDLYTNYQNRKEQRQGNKITGSYSVVDSDGFIRTVQYTADPKEGFKAEVTRQPTDIVVKIPKPDPQYQNIQQTPQPQQRYVQEQPAPSGQHQQYAQSQPPNVVYRYE